jgi:hypothetical protein
VTFDRLTQRISKHKIFDDDFLNPPSNVIDRLANVNSSYIDKIFRNVFVQSRNPSMPLRDPESNKNRSTGSNSAQRCLAENVIANNRNAIIVIMMAIIPMFPNFRTCRQERGQKWVASFDWNILLRYSCSFLDFASLVRRCYIILGHAAAVFYNDRWNSVMVAHDLYA